MVIAGLVAWLLALQGFAFAASSNGTFGRISPGATQTVSPGDDTCRAPRGGDPYSPCQHDHCQCCILCSSSDAGGLAWAAAIALTVVVLPPLRTTGAIAWRLPRSENKPPSGWTSSWSQRAPPRFS